VLSGRPWWTLVLALALPAGLPAAADGDEAPHARIRFDLTALDAAGLYGPPDGLRALSYEFCIPDRPDTLAEVRGIDASVRVQRARGRIGCVDGELLCIGHTHQPAYRDVLLALARLPYVVRIEQAFFE
jgi:hypothetical protein